MTDIALLVHACWFAAEKHRTQRRKDSAETPYINHPLALVQVLCAEGMVENPEILSAAVLHDTIEDTDTTEAELRTIFGDAVAGMVLEVSDDKSLDKATRKRLQIEHAAGCSYGARLVKLADKICNLRDLAASPPADWSCRRVAEYYEWAGQVIAVLRGTNPHLEAAFDREMLKKPLCES